MAERIITMQCTMIILAHCICAKIIIDSVLKAQHKACQIYFGRLHF